MGWCIGDEAERLHGLGRILATVLCVGSVAYTASARRHVSAQGIDVLGSARLDRFAADNEYATP